MSHEVMIPRSAAEGQEVNSRNADEVFPEHAPSKEAEGDTFLVSTCIASVHSQGRTSALAGRSGPRPSAWGADSGGGGPLCRRPRGRFDRNQLVGVQTKGGTCGLGQPKGELHRLLSNLPRGILKGLDEKAVSSPRI